MRSENVLLHDVSSYLLLLFEYLTSRAFLQNALDVALLKEKERVTETMRVSAHWFSIFF